MSIDSHIVRDVDIRLGGIIHIRIPTGGLGPSELDGKCSLLLTAEIGLTDIKGNGPIVNIPVALYLLGPYSVGITTKDAPVDIIEVGGFIRRSHMEVDTIWEIIQVVICCPVDAILWWVERMVRVRMVTMEPFTA